MLKVIKVLSLRVLRGVKKCYGPERKGKRKMKKRKRKRKGKVMEGAKVHQESLESSGGADVRGRK